MKTRWIIAALAVAGVAFAASKSQAADQTTVGNVDLKRYAGLWYEQANFPMFFQRKCAKNTRAEYTLREDGMVTVVNSCDTKEGKRIQSEGVARMKGKDPSKLEVRFAPNWLSALPFVWGDYWIIELDPDYKWSIVGSPSKKYLWILTRDKRIDWAMKEQLIQRARRHGYDVSRIVETKQD